MENEESDGTVPVLKKQGLSPQEIARPLGGTAFVLEDSGEAVVMRKPLVDDYIAAKNDASVTNDTEELLAVISLVTTFDGKARNWHDCKKMSMMDYNDLSVAYYDLTRSKKAKGAVQ